MSYLPEKKKGPTSKKWLCDAANGLDEFLRGDGWLYDFSKESAPNNKDCEAAYLSQCFFYELMHTLAADEVLSNCKQLRKICVKLNDVNKSQEFHFDVMNNPKINRRIFSKNIMEKCSKEWANWFAIYHTIGNFTPIPWPRNVKPHLQLKHSLLDERWDLFLHYLRCEWSKDWEVGISFFQYMQLTCQEIYYQKVYDEFHDLLKSKNLAKLDDQVLLKWYEKLKENEWYEKLEESGRLISFGEDAKEDVERIINLISYRGLLMMALVRQKKGIDRGI